MISIKEKYLTENFNNGYYWFCNVCNRTGFTPGAICHDNACLIGVAIDLELWRDELIASCEGFVSRIERKQFINGE